MNWGDIYVANRSDLVQSASFPASGAGAAGIRWEPRWWRHSSPELPPWGFLRLSFSRLSGRAN